jgi:hypothetical protein
MCSADSALVALPLPRAGMPLIIKRSSHQVDKLSLDIVRLGLILGTISFFIKAAVLLTGNPRMIASSINLIR